MTTIRNFTDIYHKEYAVFTEKRDHEEAIIQKNNDIIDRAYRSTERARKRMDALKRPHWTELIIKKITKEMMAYFPDHYVYEILGPFGLNASVFVLISHPDWDVHKANNYPHYNFEFVPNLRSKDDANLKRVDRTINTGEFTPNSIGAINGFNHPQIPIPNETTIKKLILMFYPDFEFEENVEEEPEGDSGDFLSDSWLEKADDWREE